MPTSMRLNGFGDTEVVTFEHDWPKDCLIQGGSRGVVFTKGSMAKALEDPVKLVQDTMEAKENGGSDKARVTAYFEAFPCDPQNPSERTFLRGEGADIYEAEEKVWNAYQGILKCPGHEWERRNRKDGYAWCTKCKYRGLVLEPLTACASCGVKTYWSVQDNGTVLCEEHAPPRRTGLDWLP